MDTILGKLQTPPGHPGGLDLSKGGKSDSRLTVAFIFTIWTRVAYTITFLSDAKLAAI